MKRLPYIPQRFTAAHVGTDARIQKCWAVFDQEYPRAPRRLASDMRAADARRIARLLNIGAAWDDGLLVVRGAEAASR